MTTIVYNNEIIVADCMSTISYRNKAEEASPVAKEKGEKA